MPAKFQFDQTEAVTSVRPSGPAAYGGSRTPPPPPASRPTPPPSAGGNGRRKKLVWAIVAVGVVGIGAAVLLASMLRPEGTGPSHVEAAAVHAGQAPARGGGDHRRKHHEEKHHGASRPSSSSGGGAGVPPAFSP